MTSATLAGSPREHDPPRLCRGAALCQRSGSPSPIHTPAEGRVPSGAGAEDRAGARSRTACWAWFPLLRPEHPLHGLQEPQEPQQAPGRGSVPPRPDPPLHGLPGGLGELCHRRHRDAPPSCRSRRARGPPGAAPRPTDRPASPSGARGRARRQPHGRKAVEQSFGKVHRTAGLRVITAGAPDLHLITLADRLQAEVGEDGAEVRAPADLHEAVRLFARRGAIAVES